MPQAGPAWELPNKGTLPFSRQSQSCPEAGPLKPPTRPFSLVPEGPRLGAGGVVSVEWKGAADMASLVIGIIHLPTKTPCGVCGRPTSHAPGPALFVAESVAAVCRECGSLHAPSLAALLKLGRVAERVGRVGRHTLSPPLAMMIDLAHAAEAYTHSNLGPKTMRAA